MWATFRRLIGAALATLVITFGLAQSPAWATNNSLILLIPDNFTLPDPRVSAWLDAAQEEGLQLTVMSDTQFMQAGSALQQYPGLILPDQVHVNADDTLVTAIQNYVLNGGKAMLVYDFGALTSTGFYPVPKSRFSSIVGVDYVLYDQLRDGTIGLGPVTGMGSTLRTLQVPPGKSMTWTTTSTPAATPATTTATAMTATANISSAAVQPAAKAKQVLYLPASPSNPGGLRNYNHNVYFNYKTPGAGSGLLSKATPKVMGTATGAQVKAGSYNAATVGTTGSLGKSRAAAQVSSLAATTAAVTTTDVLEGISGYVYGFLTYPSFVTQGTYTGTPILTSPNFGLVAGYNTYGNGGVLFVNTPLAYLEGQTDGMLMHGFLHYLGVNLLGMPTLSLLPKAQAGMVLNWHFCAGDEIAPAVQLKNQGIFNNGPFSVVITAGPDQVNFGDGLGVNLANNTTAKSLVTYLLSKGHNIGSHGGWIHDYWGANASETNASTFTQYLVLNQQAIVAATHKPSVEYAAPEGNTPTWSVTWLENNGVVGYYFTGHTGMAPTRAYRNGSMLNTNIWAFPVMPFGVNATFEEFEDNHVATADVTNWYTALMNFTVNYRTSRLIYMHPLGAVDYPTVLSSIFTQANTLIKAGQFRWYTMNTIATFDKRRLSVTWQATDTGTGWSFAATHPTDLTDMTWQLPKTSFAQPAITKGSGTVTTTDATYWLVTAKSGTSLNFTSAKVQ
ncbi:Membrane protein [Pararobbsia alpina]|uniref:hypothetical protein n=1 Tax=Pararobbsia alpina TaxID=621374 RepID=UPI0039A66A66